MMRVSSVRIMNFKSFIDTSEVSLGQVNVLVGRNNHGKSAFIRAVNLMQAGMGISQADIRLGESSAEIYLTVTGEDLTDLQRYFGQAAGWMPLPVKLTLRGGGISIEVAPPPGVVTPVRGLGQITAEEPHNFIYTYLSKRKVYAFERAVDLRHTVAVLPNLSNLVSKVARLANADFERAPEYEALCKAVLGFRVSVHAALDGNGQQAGIPVGKFGYIPLESMGEGVSSQLGLITDLCMADGNLFLIEEPENDIHPEGLKALLNVIVEKSRNNQFIVSTHSNIVTRYLGSAPDSKIFEFESEYRRNEIPTSTIREVEPTVEARSEVLRRLGYELSDFDLWDGWLILEESSAEIIIRYLIPWFVPGLARIRTVAAGGTSKVEPTFEDFRRLFLFAHLERQYHGRAWVIVDGDDEGRSVVRALKAKYKGWPAAHFVTWSKPDFEYYYPSQFAEQVMETMAEPHDKKPAAKKKLLDQVKAWCEANREEAKAAFADSALEVIQKLSEIDGALRG